MAIPAKILPAPIPGSGGSGSAGTVTTPTINNLTATLANTEYSHAFAANTKEFYLYVRSGGGDLKVSFTSGQSGTNYLTIGPTGFIAQSNIAAASLTIYYQATQAGTEIEVLSWV